MTKSQWERASEKAQWDIKVALRGPDSNYGETLKWFTTSVIRGQMQNVFRVGGLVNPDLELVVLPGRGELTPTQKEELKGTAAWNCRHFCDHIQTAAAHIGIGLLRIEASVWHKVMRGESALAAGETILARAVKFLEEHEGKASAIYPLYDPAAIKELERHLKNGLRF